MTALLQRPLPRATLFDRPFWDHANRGELRLQRCSDCGTLRAPPGPTCPHCLSPHHDWTLLSGRGVVVAWTVFHRQYFPQLPVPYAVVSVRTDEGPLLVGNLVEAGSMQPRVGLPVQAVFEQAAGPEGPWTIVQWRPAPG